jgi:hypothetical protein
MIKASARHLTSPPTKTEKKSLPSKAFVPQTRPTTTTTTRFKNVIFIFETFLECYLKMYWTEDFQADLGIIYKTFG